jgi:hypothetical protein
MKSTSFQIFLILLYYSYESIGSIGSIRDLPSVGVRDLIEFYYLESSLPYNVPTNI